MHKGQTQASRDNKLDPKPKFKSFLLDQIFQKEAPVVRQSDSPKPLNIKYSPKKPPSADPNYGSIKIQRVPLTIESPKTSKRTNKSVDKDISTNISPKRGQSKEVEAKMKPIDLSKIKTAESKVTTERSASNRFYKPMTTRDQIEEETKEKANLVRLERSLDRKVTMNTSFKNTLRPSTRDRNEKSFVVSPKQGSITDRFPSPKRVNISKEASASPSRFTSREKDAIEGSKTLRASPGKEHNYKYGLIYKKEDDDEEPCPERDKFRSNIMSYLSRNVKDKHSLKFDEFKALLMKKDLLTAVVKAPEPVLGNLKFLASYFLGVTSKPLELIWLAFVFLMYKYSEKEDFGYSDDDLRDSFEGLMEKRAEISSKYATAFENVVQMLGIKCRIIKGYVKDFFYLPGTPLTNYTHTWNAVFYGSKWHLIDCSMAAGYFVYGPKYIRQIDFTYFLAAPDQLIITHYPEAKNWQLLERIRTVEDMEKFIPFTPNYKELGVALLGCTNPYVNFSEEEHILKVKYPPGVNIFAEVSKDDLMYTMPNLIYPIQKKEESLVEYHVLLPDESEFFLRLYGKKNTDQHYRLLFGLRLMKEKKSPQKSSGSPKKKALVMTGPFTYLKSFPKINSLLFDKYDMNLATHRYSIYHEQNENDTLQIAVKVGHDIRLTAGLFKEMNSKPNEKAVFIHHKDDLYIFEIVFPESYLYKLVIYLLDPESNGEKVSVIEYPIYAKILSKSTKSLTFPEADFENLEKYNIQLTSHHYNIQHHGGSVTNPEPVILKIKTERNMILVPRIRCNDYTINTDNLFLYTIERNSKENIHKIDCIFPKTEIYKLEFFGQLENSGKEKFELIFFVRYELDITMNKNNMALMSIGGVGFPRKFDPCAVILAPMRKLLKNKNEHEFKIEFSQDYEKGIIEHNENIIEMRKCGVVHQAKYKPDDEGVIAIKAKLNRVDEWHTIAEYYCFN